ncbi:MAG: hypothetical protein LBB85_01645 [Dysgonamonadaceae bacterium]|jgi:hypothetical protein|nr:hypothetical protein [Dysgonamonadaceae bacterium]
MQAKELTGLMKGEIAYTEDTLLQLKAVLEEYPYFQTAQFLYTLHLQAAKDSRFNAELRKSACYSGDRRNLFYRIQSAFFHPEWIKKIEKSDESAANSSFEWVDFFLSEQATKTKVRKPASSLTVSGQTVSTDYLSYTLSESSDTATNTETPPLQHQEAIDKFLTENEKAPIKIVPKDDSPDDETPPPPNLDIVNESSFFSETLAKIYLKQKKYAKTLEIIRKLYLLYPEKNRYFADQIRFLEKLVINTKK